MKRGDVFFFLLRVAVIVWLVLLTYKILGD